MNSYILLCRDLERAYESLLEKYANQRICSFLPEKDEFLLEDAKKVVKEAYIAESEEKILILCAKGYRIEAQNSLLKILEEPPRNIVFILIAPSKMIFLPTIRSRLGLEELKIPQKNTHSGLDIARLDEKIVYEFVHARTRIDKSELKELVQNITTEAILEHGLVFSSKELDHFSALLSLCELNSRPQAILFSLLLTIMQRQRALA